MLRHQPASVTTRLRQLSSAPCVRGLKRAEYTLSSENKEENQLRVAEAALRDARARLEVTLRAGEIGTWTWDIATNRVTADRNLARLFDMSDQDAAGSPI